MRTLINGLWKIKKAYLRSLIDQMKIFFNKEAILDLIFIFILSLTPLLWFRKDSIMVGHDNVFPLNPSVFFDGRLSSWIELGFGRSQALIMGTLPVHFVDVLPHWLSFSLQANQKIVYVFWFFLMALSIYILATTINKKSRYFKLTAVVFYVFNFFILQGWWIGERTKFSAYIAFPLVLAVFFKVYKNELSVIKGAILTSFILFIFNGGGVFGTPLFGGYFIALITFIIFFSVISYLRKELDVVKRIILLFIFASIGFVLINSYYIFPALSQVFFKYTEGVQKTGGVDGLIDWASEISANASYGNLLRLQGIAEWYDNPEHPYAKFFLTNPILIAISFLWPFLIFLTLFLIKKRSKLKIVIYFLIVYLLGIFFSAGTHPPFGFIYALFMKTIPGFIIFRSPYFKFAPAIFLAASILIAFFVDHFEGKTKKIIFSFLIFTVFAYHFPYFTGDFFSWRKGFSTRNSIPSYIFDFGKWSENQKGEGRILLLPPANNNWQYDIYKWGYLSLQTLPTLVTNKEIVSNDDKISTEESLLLQKLYDAIESGDLEITKKLANTLGFKYFLIRNDIESNLEWAPVKTPDFYKGILEDNFKLLPVNHFGEWALYELKQKDLSKFTFIDRVDNIYGSSNNINDYLSFSDNNSSFVFYSNMKPYLEELSPEYIIPDCLNCRHEVPPSINFPRSLILPDSIFYPIVKYKEENEVKNLTTKEKVYADLGHTLKRIGEILATLDQGKAITLKLFTNYLEVLKRVEKDFNKVSNFKDKFETAEDISYYLTPQKKFLNELLGTKINERQNLQKMDEIFNEIFNIETLISPYLFESDSSSNRIFQLTLSNQGLYEVFLKGEDIQPILKENSFIKLSIDEQERKEIKLDNGVIKDKWISFGNFNFSSGTHKLFLSLPPLPNLLENFSRKDEWLVSKMGNNCYGGNIKNFNNKKVYKLKLDISNDFSEVVQLYEVREKNGQAEITSVAAFKKHFEADSYQALIYSLSDINNISVYVCSANLNEAISQNKLKINVTEVIHPDILIQPKTENFAYNKINLSYKMISPTKYIVNVNSVKPGIIVFAERYDEGWNLSDFDNNHFKVNGYANGWYLNKTGKYNLVLEYQPQKYFYYGLLISLITILGGLTYIIKRRNN